MTFLKDQAGGGFSINFRVRNGSGKVWVAKLKSEAQPETAAVRLMWALGYVTEINYLVPCIKFAYGGKNSGLFDNITVEQAKWIGTWLARLSDKQLSDAFRAANYTPEEVQVLTDATRARINQLTNLQ